MSLESGDGGGCGGGGGGKMLDFTFNSLIN